MPELSDLTIKEFHNGITQILAAMADVLESNEAPDLRKLVETAPEHGFHRFMLDYDLVELFSEERILRRAIVQQVELELARQCSSEEAAALHSLIDIMLQQGVLAFVQQLSRKLRHGTEAELKYLSFLSHDLSNSLFVISSNLQFLQKLLADHEELRDSADALRAATETIQRTREGMKRLLEHERLRRSGLSANAATLQLRAVVEPVVNLATPATRDPRPRPVMEIDAGIVVRTDAALLTIVLQNLVGNAMKHAKSSVRVKGERRNGQRGESVCRISVIDDGPGVPRDQLERLFKAFETMPQPNAGAGTQEGFGLGLAIASQAAALLGSTIEVASTAGEGSTFWLEIPAAAD